MTGERPGSSRSEQRRETDRGAPWRCSLEGLAETLPLVFWVAVIPLISMFLVFPECGFLACRDTYPPLVNASLSDMARHVAEVVAVNVAGSLFGRRRSSRNKVVVLQLLLLPDRYG